MRHLPVDSHTAGALGSHGWTITDVLLADLFHATTGKRHPARPRRKTPTPPKRRAAVLDARLVAQHERRARELAALATT